MTDDFEPVRRLRPDDALSEDQADPSVSTRAKDDLMSTIAPDTTDLDASAPSSPAR